MKNTVRKSFVVASLLVACSSVVNSEMIRLADEVVVDTDKNLMWQDNYEAKTVKKNWQGAIDYCDNLTFAGYSNWRLPDKNTLKDLYHKKASLQNVSSGYYWSSSPYASGSGLAWRVNFDNGIDWHYKSYSYLDCR